MNGSSGVPPGRSSALQSRRFWLASPRFPLIDAFLVQDKEYIIGLLLLMSGTKRKLKLDQNEIREPKGEPEPFNLAKLKDGLDIRITNRQPESLQFDIVGIDASVANALRRIMIAEVPTMALHKVFLYQNTSVLPDELLVHRIGLLPLNMSCEGFKERKDDEELNDTNSIKFELKAVCKRKAEYKHLTEQQIEEQKLKPQEYLTNSSVYSRDIQWVPSGNQSPTYTPYGPLHPNILIAKLRQNQQIHLIVYAEKGIGKRHAKWSPVSTAFYRLMPSINILPTFQHSKYAEALEAACPGNVFKVKKGKAQVVDARSCTTCRECLKLEGVELQKVCDHFLFTIESTGKLSPEEIFLEAVQILGEKAKAYEV